MRYMSEKGFDVVMASSAGDELADILLYEGVDHKSFNLTRSITPIADFITLIRLTRFIRKEKFDIIHSHTPKAGLIGLIAGFLGGAKVRLHTIAGIPWMERKGLMRTLLKTTDKFAYFFASRVYSNSQNLKEFVLNQGLVNSKKLKVIGNGSSNGIDTDFFSQDALELSKDELRLKNSIPSSAFVYIFVGRVVKDKGIEELIESFQELPTNTQLLIIGPLEEDLDPISPKSLSMIRQEPRIHQLGYKSDVRPFLKMSDTLVFPSYREGFPNVPMQAGAMGLPTIASDINGCNEIIIPHQNGLLIEPKDTDSLYKAMLQMLNQKDAYLRMKDQSRKMIVDRYDQQYIWSEIFKEYEELMETS